jgi:hypothetical protein
MSRGEGFGFNDAFASSPAFFFQSQNTLISSGMTV